MSLLNQRTGPSNWQHGELYVTAAETKARDYARGGAEFGGELLTQCAEALERLKAVDAAAAARLREQFSSLKPFLAGGGTPLLVVLVDVPANALGNEARVDPIDEQIDQIEGHLARSASPLLQYYLQGFQFRLRPGCGIVKEIRNIPA